MNSYAILDHVFYMDTHFIEADNAAVPPRPAMTVPRIRAIQCNTKTTTDVLLEQQQWYDLAIVNPQKIPSVQIATRAQAPVGGHTESIPFPAHSQVLYGFMKSLDPATGQETDKVEFFIGSLDMRADCLVGHFDEGIRMLVHRFELRSTAIAVMFSGNTLSVWRSDQNGYSKVFGRINL